MYLHLRSKHATSAYESVGVPAPAEQTCYISRSARHIDDHHQPFCSSAQATEPEAEPETAEEAPEEAPPAKAQKGGKTATPRGVKTGAASKAAPVAEKKTAAKKAAAAPKPAAKATKATKAKGTAPRQTRCVTGRIGVSSVLSSTRLSTCSSFVMHCGCSVPHACVLS